MDTIEAVETIYQLATGLRREGPPLVQERMARVAAVCVALLAELQPERFTELLREGADA